MCIARKLPAGVTGGYDFVDVRDVAKGCLQAAKMGKPGNCYILSNRYFTVKELLECVRRVNDGSRKLCLTTGLVMPTMSDSWNASVPMTPRVT